ncbi:hypothetical protein RIF29_28607 [Crotalaria pallida]|uniref:VQ domain-containing protein n=1 Tax=Crotalaria pallida TaxID=3830 RepID=A0AAN9HT45_CROPI
MASNSSATTTTLHSPTTYGSDPTTPPNTTFVQADPSNFRAVVQKLTGASEDPSAHKLPLTLPSRLAQAHRPTTTIAPDIGPKKPNFKLHERRANKKLELNIGVSERPNVMFHNSIINGMNNSNNNNVVRGRGVFYMGEMVNVMASPVSPLELLARGSPRTPRSPQQEEEQRVVVEKGFYLHPVSPVTTPRPSHPPQLLPLFPLHSPNSQNHHHSSSS